MAGIFAELKWKTHQKRRKENRLTLLYKFLKGKARIPKDDLIPRNKRCRNQHSLAFQHPLPIETPINITSFLRLSGTVMTSSVDSLITSAGMMSDECVSMFTSLVRARY